MNEQCSYRKIPKKKREEEEAAYSNVLCSPSIFFFNFECACRPTRLKPGRRHRGTGAVWAWRVCTGSGGSAGMEPRALLRPPLRAASPAPARAVHGRRRDAWPAALEASGNDRAKCCSSPRVVSRWLVLIYTMYGTARPVFSHRADTGWCSRLSAVRIAVSQVLDTLRLWLTVPPPQSRTGLAA